MKSKWVITLDDYVCTMKLTQEQLSAKLQIKGIDITRSALAKIEVGQRHIYPDEIKGIKDILDISYDQIFPDNFNQ